MIQRIDNILREAKNSAAHDDDGIVGCCPRTSAEARIRAVYVRDVPMKRRGLGPVGTLDLRSGRIRSARVRCATPRF